MRVIDKHPPPSSRLARWTLFGLLAACLIVGAGLLKSQFLRNLVRNPRAVLIDTPRNYVEARMHAVDLPAIQVDMKFKHYQKVLDKRKEALQRGLLFTDDGDLVPATIDHEGRSVRVKMRLKGDWPDHFKTDKWSYRIEARGGDHLFGMRRFSIQHPEARNFLGEWAYFKNLRDEGILTPRYDFVTVTFNGDEKGIFALEEHMAKELLESQERREGPILKFDENPLWQQRAKAKDLGWFPLDRQTYRNAAIDQFGKNKADADPVLREQSRAARHLLEGFRSGSLPASDVFDVARTARFMAVSRVWGAQHALIWHNLRFYYNPVTTRLEPIAFDGEPSAWTREDMMQVHVMGGGDALWIQIRAWDHWTGDLLADPVLARAFLAELHRVSSEAYIDGVEAKWGEAAHDLMLSLRTEWPLVENPFPALRRGAAFFREKLLPEAAIAARWAGTGHTEVEVANLADVPLEVLSVRTGDATRALADPPVLKPCPRGGALEWTPVPIVAGPSPDSVLAAVSFRTVAGTVVREVTIGEPVPVFAEGLVLSERHDLATTLATHPFLKSDSNGSVTVPSGEWNLHHDLLLPRGVKLTVEGGAVLRFGPDAILVAQGPMEFAGTAALPILLTSAEESWPGIACIGSETPSSWSFVRVENTRSIDRPGWILTGGVTFYESPVTLTDCAFSDHRGEDALNIIRSTFAMERCAFSGAASDAFDGDFVTGKIHDSVFHDIHGDGVDVSGATLELRNVRAWNIGDKAISVGEDSEARAFDLDIENAAIGVAAKDLSRALIQGGRGVGLGIAFAAYTKKPTYGPARIEVIDFTLATTAQIAMVQTGSSVRVGDQVFEGVELDVKELYRLGVLGN